MSNELIILFVGTATNLIIAIGGWYAARESRKKITAEAEKVTAEGRRINVEYFEKKASDLEKRLDAQELSHQSDMGHIRDALDYLCDQVRGAYPVAVSIAQEIAAGRLNLPKVMPKENRKDLKK